MVTHWWLSMGEAFVNGAIDLVPEWISPPDWMPGTIVAFVNLLNSLETMSAWIPLPIAFGAAAWTFAVVAGGLVIKLVRIVASFATFGGGSAA